MERRYIVKLESFDGRDTYLNCGNDEQDYLYCVIGVGDDGRAEVVDSAYRSYAEAAEAWPEAAKAT